MIRPAQPLQTEEMAELTSALYQALDGIVDRRKDDRDEENDATEVVS